MEYVRDFVYNDEDNLPSSWWSTYDNAPIMPNHNSGLDYFSQESYIPPLPSLSSAGPTWPVTDTLAPISHIASGHIDCYDHRSSGSTHYSEYNVLDVNALYNYNNVVEPPILQQAADVVLPYTIEQEYDRVSSKPLRERSLSQNEAALLTPDVPLLPPNEYEDWSRQFDEDVAPQYCDTVHDAYSTSQLPYSYETQTRGISAPPFTAHTHMPGYLDAMATESSQISGAAPFKIRSASALPRPMNTPLANKSMTSFHPGSYYSLSNNTVDYVSHSRASRPRPVRNLPSNRQTLSRMGPRDLRRDQLLVDLKASGMSYKDIKEQYGFAEAESTLRGRYRTLIKAPCQRVRQPPWPKSAVEALIEGVHLFTSSQDASNKTPWKKIAEWMERERGCYGYCATTIKKKYMRVLGAGALLHR